MDARRAKTRPRGFGIAVSPAPQEDAPILANLERCRYHWLMCNAYEQHARWVEYSQMMRRPCRSVAPRTSPTSPRGSTKRYNNASSTAPALGGNDLVRLSSYAHNRMRARNLSG